MEPEEYQPPIELGERLIKPSASSAPVPARCRLLAIASLLPEGATITLTAHAFRELAEEQKLQSLVDLAVRDVAQIYGVSESTVRSWIRSGRLEAYKVGRRYFVTQTGMKKFRGWHQTKERRSGQEQQIADAGDSKLGSWRRVRSR